MLASMHVIMTASCFGSSMQMLIVVLNAKPRTVCAVIGLIMLASMHVIVVLHTSGNKSHARVTTKIVRVIHQEPTEIVY